MIFFQLTCIFYNLIDILKIKYTYIRIYDFYCFEKTSLKHNNLNHIIQLKINILRLILIKQ